MFCKFLFRSTIKFSLKAPVKRKFTYEKLNYRSLVSVKGDDRKAFLQGVISNDVSCVSDCFGSVYSLLLNAKGRVLFDVILYENADSFFLECDNSSVPLLMRHLSMYKLRKSVSIKAESDAEVAVVTPDEGDITEDINSLRLTEKDCGQLIYFGSDPRIPGWCVRCVSLQPCQVESLLVSRHDVTSSPATSLEPSGGAQYREWRMRLGVWEGPQECGLLPLPLEMNGDIMHGISFNKGCYLGQELTARTHHTGVVRKRLVPLQILSSDIGHIHTAMESGIAVNLVLRNSSNDHSDDSSTVIGQLKYVMCGQEDGLVFGLGLVRVSYLGPGTTTAHVIISSNQNLQRPSVTVELEVPPWWPPEVGLPIKPR